MDNGSLVGARFPDAVRRFGHELRRRRTQAGLTQRQLAERVSYSREMVAAVERGRRYGSEQLAVRCDAILRTDGSLTRLWPMVESEQVAADRRRGPRTGRAERMTGAPAPLPSPATARRTGLPVAPRRTPAPLAGMPVAVVPRPRTPLPAVPHPGAPRPGVVHRPVPVRTGVPAPRNGAAIWAEWARSLRPDPTPELMDQLRDLINNLMSANGRTGR